MMKVGLLCGREYSFPQAFVERVNARGHADGIAAEMVKLGGTPMNEPAEYRVIVDRISHEVAYYRGYLKHAVLQGTYVINNPFWWTADDKFFNYSVAARLGVAIPRTVLLPQKSYPSDVDIVSESLRNLKYPLDWDGLAREIGMPCILKDAHGGGWKEVHVCHSLDDLIHHYDQSGLLTMVVSLEAIFLSTFVMISQNRADEKRQVLADNQWKIVQFEEAQNAQLIELSKQILELTKAIHAVAITLQGQGQSGS